MEKPNSKKKINFRQIDITELTQIINDSKEDKAKLNNLYILDDGDILLKATTYRFRLDDLLNKTWFKKEIIDKTHMIYADEEVHGITLYLWGEE